MIKKKEFSEVSAKLHGGPGGWHCNCCNPFGCSTRKMKPKARRLYRRVTKIKFNKDVEVLK